MTFPGQEMPVTTANVLRDGGKGEQMAKELISRGYISLTEETAKLYARGLGVAPKDEERLGGRLLSGEKAMLRETVVEGRATIPIIEKLDVLSAKEEAEYLKDIIRDVEKKGDPLEVLGNLREYLARIEASKAIVSAGKAQELVRKGMRSGGLVLAMAAQAYLFDRVQQAELDKAATYFDQELRGPVEILNQQGLWVAVIAVMDVPQFVDVGSLLTGYKEIREINHFVTLYYQSGKTKEEALQPSAEATIGPASAGQKYPSEIPTLRPPEGRKWVDILWLI